MAMLSQGQTTRSAPALGSCGLGFPKSGTKSPGLIGSVSDVIMERGGVTGGCWAQRSALERQAHATELSHMNRTGALFGSHPRRNPEGSPLRTGAKMAVTTRPFCAPRDDRGSLSLRVAAVTRNIQYNRKELSDNRLFLDEVQEIEERGRESKRSKRIEMGLPPEDTPPPSKDSVAERPRLMHQRIAAAKENLEDNGKELEQMRKTVDNLLIFANKKQVEPFDHVNFSKTGLPPFSLSCGGKTNTYLRMEALISQAKLNEETLREHSSMMDEVKAARKARESKSKERARTVTALEAKMLGQDSGSKSSTARPEGTLVGRLDAVTEAAKSNASELRVFRGTIQEVQDAQKRDLGVESDGKTYATTERIYQSGALRQKQPRRTDQEKRAQEIRHRVESLSQNASRNFEQLSTNKGGIIELKADKEPDQNATRRSPGAPTSPSRSGGAPASPSRSGGGFGVKM